MGKLTEQEVLKRFKTTHGSRYDYSLFKYTRTNIKSVIICEKHGEFIQTPHKHWSGQGCPKCAGKYKTTKDVIEQFFSVHGDKYDYSLVDFKLNNTKLEIICKIHGVFKQKYDSHIEGGGCPNCSFNKQLTTKDFIYKSKGIYGDKYDYSQVDYISCNNKGKIICKEHGLFTQLPSNHYKAEGCSACYKNSRFKTTDEFIKDARLKHKDKYDYSKTIYIRNDLYIKIICPIHGLFSQKGYRHLTGCGCPKCGREMSNKYHSENPTGWGKSKWKESGLKSRYFDSFKVYIIRCYNDKESFYKIGRTFTTVYHRFANKKINMPYNYEIIKEYIFKESDKAYDYENKLKREYKKFKYSPLIYFKGCRECFYHLPL